MHECQECKQKFQCLTDNLFLLGITGGLTEKGEKEFRLVTMPCGQKYIKEKA